MQIRPNRGAIASLLLLFAFAGSAFAADEPTYKPDAQNPPPSAALDTFSAFELMPLKMGAPWAGQKGNEVARERLQANIDERVKPLVATWSASPSGKGRTLRIEPEIRYVRFITGGKRFFAGGFAGASSILVKLRLTDVDTGALIAEPDFYQHANALGAAWSFGATDKTMLIRISNMVSGYLESNYHQAVGSAISEAPKDKS